MTTDRLVHLQVKDPAILIGGGLKGSFGVLNPEGEHTANCVGCGTELRFSYTPLNTTIHAAACPTCKGSKFVWPELPKAPTPAPVVVEPELPGDEISDLDPPPAKVVVPKEAKPPCPVCGGPAKGRGHTHQLVNGQPCPESTEAKLAKAKADRDAAKASQPPKAPKAPQEPKAPVETCPHCGGPKRGRGFSHKDVNGQPCPATIKVVEPKAPHEPKVAKPPRPLGQRGKRMPKGMLED